MTKEVLKLALEALEDAQYFIETELNDRMDLYKNYPNLAHKYAGEQESLKKNQEAITAIKEALAQPEQESVATSTSNLREMLDIINDTDSSRWEIGFRNIVAILYGPRHTFEIKDVVENVRGLCTHPPVLTAQPEQKHMTQIPTSEFPAVKAAKEEVKQHIKYYNEMMGTEPKEQEPVSRILSQQEMALSAKRYTTPTVTAIKEALMSLQDGAQPERHELQAKGEHPAPCARFCEANAFQIEIRGLKAKLEQAQKQEALDRKADNARELGLDYEPEPVRLECVKCGTVYADGIPPQTTQKQEPFCYVNVNSQGDVTRTVKRKDAWCKTPLYASPPQPQEAAPLTPLTDEEIESIAKNYALNNPTTPLYFARAIEAATALRSKTWTKIN